MSPNGMVRACSYLASRMLARGTQTRSTPCPKISVRSPSSELISARTRSASSARMWTALSCCVRSGREVRSRRGRLIYHRAGVGAHHLSRKLKAHGHDPRLMPAKYVRPYSKGHKNDFRDAEAIAEAVQRTFRRGYGAHKWLVTGRRTPTDLLRKASRRPTPADAVRILGIPTSRASHVGSKALEQIFVGTRLVRTIIYDDS